LEIHIFVGTLSKLQFKNNKEKEFLQEWIFRSTNYLSRKLQHDSKDDCVLELDTMKSGRLLPSFQWKMLPPSSGYRSKLSTGEKVVWMWQDRGWAPNP
jgi:hypothetical protein